MTTRNLFLIIVAALVLTVAGAYLGRVTAPTEQDEHMPVTNTGEERKVLYWYDPMFPQQHFDKPGPSPFMDMALVPRYADEQMDSQPGVRIAAEMIQNLGIRSAPVVRTDRRAELNLSGQVVFNERAVTRLQSPANAFVDSVLPLADGDTVVAGQALLKLHVPAWTGAQQEWLAVLARGDSALVDAGRQRLLSLGMPANLIDTLERQRTLQTTWTVKAPHDGMVRQLSARAGMTLMAGAALTDIQSLDPAWVEIAVPQQLVGAMRTGDAVAVTIDGVNPPQREGVIGEILPVVATDSATVPVRVVLSNNDNALRPGMSAQVRILADNNTSSLAVPSEALLHTGKRTLVMLDEGDGRYRPQTVLAGTEIGDLTRIEAGLDEGQRVVVSGQFLLDSEASLLGLDAAPLPDHADGHAHDDPLHYAVGTVEKLADGRVTLSHGPFESLDMPGMTMRFRLANEDVAAGIAVGDTVRIGVRDGDDGLVVERLLKQEPQK